MERTILFFKGMCMGIADVIPGVSGGTLALILGIYAQLVDSIRGLHLRWVLSGIRWLRRGRRLEDWNHFKEDIKSLNLPFLLSLGGGIVLAVGAGSAVIPSLMERYPTEMRALFFGLIIASVSAPFRTIKLQGTKNFVLAAVFGVCGLAFGYGVTDPSQSYETTRTLETVVSRGESLKDLARRGPSAHPLEDIYWAPENAALRASVEAEDPLLARQLAELYGTKGDLAPGDKKAIKARSKPYEMVKVEPGVEVIVPQPALWFIFVAGAVAICAMILPGISGSYILLIFGVYFFVLNALKGLVYLLAQGEVSGPHFAYVGLFLSGIIIGILSFSRLLSFLLRRYPAPTLGVLVGLMIGCLRGIWPFRASVAGVQYNVWPETFGATFWVALAMTALGFTVVVVLTLVGRRKQDLPQQTS